MSNAKDAVMREIARFDDNVKAIMRDHLVTGRVDVAVHEDYVDATVELRPAPPKMWGERHGD